MSFITSQQANIQGCQITTPHSQDIRDICGTSMCAASPGPTNLFGLAGPWILNTWQDDGGGEFSLLTAAGSVRLLNKDMTGIIVQGQSYTMSFDILERNSGGMTMVSGFRSSTFNTVGNHSYTVDATTNVFYGYEGNTAITSLMRIGNLVLIDAL